jgi:hypothetical protein
MQSLSSVMNAANQAQNLQKGKIDIQRGGMAAQQERMDLQERLRLQEFSKRLEDYKTKSGEPDLNRMLTDANKLSQKYGTEFVKHFAAAHVENVAARQNLQNLNESQRAAIGRTVSAGAELPLDKQLGIINSAVEGNPGLSDWGKVAARQLTAAAKQGPAALKEAAYRFAQATTSVAEQTGAKTGQYLATGGTYEQVSPVAKAMGQDASIAATLPVGEREQASINPVTQSPMVTKKDITGRVTDVSQAPVGGGVPNLQPGDPQAIPILTQQRSAVNQAAAKVPEQRFNNKQIMALAPEALAGTGGEALTKLGSAVGVQMLPGDHAGNMQRLGHFMALQAQANASAMGAGTDQARAIAEQASGSTKWTPDAIISTAKVNDALATGVDLFNRGMEKAIKQNGGNVLAVRDFQNAWSQNFDPQAIMLHNAIQSKDKAEVDKIVKAVGGKNSAGAHMLAAKLKNMETLVKQGGL